MHGYDTAELRKKLGLNKNKNKLDDTFDCHNIDSWVLSNSVFKNGQKNPDNTEIMKLVPLRFHRRQLHLFFPSKGGIRRANGSTRSKGLKRGSVVKNIKHGICYIGGCCKGNISLHSLKSGKRISSKTKFENIEFKTYSSWRFYI
jgi:hypothetical protein